MVEMSHPHHHNRRNMLYNTGLFIACAGTAVAAQTAVAALGINMAHANDPKVTPKKVHSLEEAATMYAGVALLDASVIAPIFGAQSVWRRLHLSQ